MKSVVDYQDGKLVMKTFKPGKQCVWNNSSLYCQYLNPNGTQMHPNNCTHHLLPEEIRFQRKHPSFQFHQYNVAVNEYNCFSRTDRYVPRKYIPREKTHSSKDESDNKGNIADVSTKSQSDSEIASLESIDATTVVKNNKVEVDVRATTTSCISQNSECEVTKNHPSRDDINSNRKKDSLLSMEERPTKMTKIHNHIEPESVEVNILPPFPPMEFTLQELYAMINCDGVYDNI